MCDKPFDEKDKWMVAVTGGLLFLIVSSPCTYKLVDGVTRSVGVGTSINGCPNITGLLLQSFIFTLVIRVLLNKSTSNCKKPYTSKDRWILAAIGGMIFLLLASPFMYEILNSVTRLFGITSTDGSGCPTVGALVFNTVLYALIIRLLLR